MNRVFEDLTGEHRDFLRHSSGEKNRLTGRRRLRDHALHVTNESHVQRPVGFIEHQYRYFREIDRPLSREIQQAAGCGNEHIEASGSAP